MAHFSAEALAPFSIFFEDSIFYEGDDRKAMEYYLEIQRKRAPRVNWKGERAARASHRSGRETSDFRRAIGSPISGHSHSHCAVQIRPPAATRRVINLVTLRPTANVEATTNARVAKKVHRVHDQEASRRRGNLCSVQM